MVAFNFQKHFAPQVESGTKRQTIRAERRDGSQPCKPGDALQDDPTIRRCIGFAKAWGCSELIVVNLFAVRATDPQDMMKADDPVGPENMEHVKRAAEWVAGGGDRYGMPPAGPLVCAWGAHGAFMGQDETVLGWLENVGVSPLALRTTKHGHPAHPLYLPADLMPQALDNLRAEKETA